MNNVFEDEVWSKLVEECKNGNMAAMKLYFEIMLKRQVNGDDAEQAQSQETKSVVIVDDIDSRTGNIFDG